MEDRKGCNVHRQAALLDAKVARIQRGQPLEQLALSSTQVAAPAARDWFRFRSPHNTLISLRALAGTPALPSARSPTAARRS